MSITRRLHSLTTVLGLSALIAAPALAQTSGWTFTLRMDTDSGGGAAKRTSIVTRFQALPDRYRTEYIQATGELGAIEGAYQIFNMADSSMTMVMPAQKMASVTALNSALLKQVDVPKAGATHYTRNDVADLGAGPKILGHATRHFRVSTAGTMEWTGSGQSCSQKIDSETDYWIAPDLQLGAAGDELGPMGAMMSSAGGSSSARIPKGATLRSIARVQRPDGAGGMRTIATTMEIIDLKHEPVSEASFAIPAGFHIMDMTKAMASMPAGMMDSVMHESSAKLMTTMCANGRP